MKFLVLISFLLTGWAHAQVSDCSEIQTLQVKGDIIEARKQAQSLIQDINSSLPNQTLNTQRKLIVARTILQCARLVLPHMKWKCAKLSEDYEAMTIIFTGRAWVDREKFFINDSTKQAGTILHEATHQCGTNDAAYFARKTPGDRDIRGWQTIADTYSYWAEHGFCIPNKDCIFL